MERLRERLSDRRAIAVLAVAGLGGTFGAMFVFSAERVGAISFSPWVAAIAFEAGALAGLASSLGAVGMFVIASHVQGQAVSNAVILSRADALVLVGVGAALVGHRLRASHTRARDQARLLTALTDATVDGIALSDRDGRALIANRPMRRLTGEMGMPPAATVVDQLLAVADQMREPDAYRARMLEIGARPDVSTADEFEHVGGRVFQGFTMPVRNDSGEVRWRVWTLREMTAERELDRLRDSFVAAVSHELRTPLTSITGLVDLLGDEADALSDDGRRYLETVRRNAQRLDRLVADLLLVAQIEAKQLSVERGDVDLDDVVRLSIDAARPAAAEVEIRHEALGAPHVHADSHRLGQVLDNLLSNALKFTPAGGSVTVTTSSVDGRARLVVADTGHGIPAADIDHVFERFYRSEETTRAAIRGTGLGLSIARTIVELHDGSIAVDSEQGRGTRVTIELPAYSGAT